ncbi:hypothetical protein BDW62DRAFT_215618 [Aspergillus aurantiobrunneus]
MGQGHSTAQSGNGSSKENGAGKKDYYELLEVEQNASPEEIKKAYRKKALELHPDRNFGNIKAATDLFAEIQSAYEVLSDPQERSWYDSHRDAFLGGNAGDEVTDYSSNARMTTAGDILKLFSKFSPNMEFTDTPNGFYGGLRETFAQLALEEKMACRWEDMEFIEYPPFGSRDDELQVVRDFYVVWGSFSTKKSFSWKDAYRYSEAPDRRVRRMMEKENKRLREGAVREFNEAVRSLVAFAKKRDPRYKSYKDNLSQHHEALRRSAASQATRSRVANHAKFRNHVLQDWAKSGEPEEDVAESLEEDETEQFECVVCRKTFKSQNQFQAHERSRKHIKAVKQLRWEMKMQHEELHLGDVVDDSKEVQVAGDNSHQDGPDDISPYLSKQISTRSNDQTKHRNSKTTDYGPREVLEHRLEQGAFPTSVDDLSRNLSASRLDETPSSIPIKTGKAKQRRAKKAQLAAEKAHSTECTVCKASFSSRNKLFSHIKWHQQQ